MSKRKIGVRFKRESSAEDKIGREYCCNKCYSYVGCKCWESKSPFFRKEVHRGNSCEMLLNYELFD